MTLILAITGRHTIWLLADRRLSTPSGKSLRDDARKVMFLETTDGVAILGYAGIGATARGTEPSGWMSNVLRGRNWPLEPSLGAISTVMQQELRPYMRSVSKTDFVDDSDYADKPFEEIDAELETAYSSLKLILDYCESLLPGMEGLPAKRGQRGLRWYDEYLKIMLEVAVHLGVDATTDARSSKTADVTVFTMLVFECERIFPTPSHFKTPVACARRIERSLKRLRSAQQKAGRRRYFRRVTTPAVVATLCVSDRLPRDSEGNNGPAR